VPVPESALVLELEPAQVPVPESALVLELEPEPKPARAQRVLLVLVLVLVLGLELGLVPVLVLVLVLGQEQAPGLVLAQVRQPAQARQLVQVLAVVGVANSQQPLVTDSKWLTLLWLLQQFVTNHSVVWLLQPVCPATAHHQPSAHVQAAHTTAPKSPNKAKRATKPTEPDNRWQQNT